MNLIDPIHAHAASRPHDHAIMTARGNISWARLDALIWSAALGLDEAGLKAGDKVGITMADPVIHLVLSLSLARIGVAHLAIPVSSSSQVRKELAARLGLKTLFSDLGNLVAAEPNLTLFDQPLVLGVSPDQKRKLAAGDGGLTWLILQSSGTTGDPKFAELTHSTARDRLSRFLPLFACHQADIFWAASRPDFVVAKQRLIFSLLAGAAVCLPSASSISPDLVKFLNQKKISLACGTPSHLHQLLAVGVPIPSLRAFEARSAFISEKLREAFRSKISGNLYIVYGTNEGEALAIADPALQKKVPNTVGVATGSLAIEIVDGNDSPVPAMQTGRVRVKGPGLVAGYFNNPVETGKSFRDGWFYPGDLGYLGNEGALVLQGREDDMMIFDGMNIYPVEIENVLSSHPAVKEVAAFALKHERFQDVPVAAVTLGAPISEQDLIAYCRAPLGFKHPKKIFILEEFPRNPMGKILKRDLPHVVGGR